MNVFDTVTSPDFLGIESSDRRAAEIMSDMAENGAKRFAMWKDPEETKRWLSGESEVDRLRVGGWK